MGLIQSEPAYVVSQQSDTDEITDIRSRSWTRGHLGWWEQLSKLDLRLFEPVNWTAITQI